MKAMSINNRSKRITMSAIKYFLFISCFTISLFGCKEDLAQVTVTDVSRSEVTQILSENTSLISRVFSDTTFQLHEGVEATDIHYLSKQGYSMRAFVLEVDLKQPGLELKPLTPYGSTGFAMQTVPEMTNYIEAPGNKTLAAVNADFFNMSTGEPRSIVYLEGEAVRTILPETRSYFGVSKTGELMIGDAADYEQDEDQIYHALGGAHWLVRNKSAVAQSNVAVEPRTAVGYTDDQVVYFIVVDGRRFDYSNGITLSGLSEIMLAFGTTEAINLDGGGSSTFVINNPRADTLQVLNSPSDGTPRPVANGWAIVAIE